MILVAALNISWYLSILESLQKRLIVSFTKYILSRFLNILLIWALIDKTTTTQKIFRGKACEVESSEGWCLSHNKLRGTLFDSSYTAEAYRNFPSNWFTDFCWCFRNLILQLILTITFERNKDSVLQTQILDDCFAAYVSNSSFLTGEGSLEKCKDHVQFVLSVNGLGE